MDKPCVITYCEGNDTKLAVVTKEKGKLKVLEASTFDVVQPAIDLEGGMTGLKLEGDELSLEGMESGIVQDQSAGLSSVSLMNDALKGINLKTAEFIPAVTEPSIYYHIFEGNKVANSSKLTEDILSDIQESKNVTIDKENLGYTEMSDKSLLAVFLSGEVGCIKMINNLARYNGRRYYKINSVKSAEVSLAYYVAKKKKFFPDDQSLVVYIGKEYSKLIFLHGRKLKHIGTTLDIGTLNLHTYDVYFSKILLEMENGGISSLDNIVVCGEDDSENLILSFYGTFPEANVTRLEFEELDLSAVDNSTKEIFSSFSVPIAVATDYFDELEEIHKGINLLPKYVKEEQKFFQFAWHGFAILPLLFVATLFLTQKILINQREIKQLDDQITEQTLLMKKNQAILSKISALEGNINNFSKTQAILDSASVGTGEWTKIEEQISTFIAGRKSIWITKMAGGEGSTVVLEGYALSRKVLTDFAYFLKMAELKSVNYESLRDKDAYKFNMTFNLTAYR